MIEIEENKVVDTLEDKITKKIVDELKDRNGVVIYKAQYYGLSCDLAEKICRRFVDKGYHAKINYFSINGRLQAFFISKTYLEESTGRAIYTEILG